MGVRRDRAPVSRAGQLSLAPQTRSPANNGVVLRGTESLLTLCWREMDSNYWSRHGEPPSGARHMVSAHGSTSLERH